MSSLLVENGRALESRIDFSAPWRALKANWWKVVLFALLMTLAAAPFILVMPPYYQASAALLLKADTDSASPVEPIYRVDTSRREYYNTQFELLKSRRVADKVVTSLGLADEPEFNGQPDPDGWWARLKGLVREPQIESESARHQHALDYLAKHLTVSPVRDTQLVSIGFESRSAELAARVANEVAKTHIALSVEERVDANTMASKWNQTRLEEVKASLNRQEQRLGDFLASHDLLTFRGVDGLQTEELGIITNKHADARERRLAAQAEYQSIQGYGGCDPATLASLPEVSNHPQMQDLRIALIKAQQALSELSKRYGPRHERILQAQARITALNTQSDRLLREIARGIQERYQSALHKEQQYLQQLEEKKREFASLAVKKDDYNNLKNNIDKTRQLYNELFRRQEETRLNAQLHEPSAILYDDASVPLLPSKPNKLLFLLMVLIMAGMVAVLVVISAGALRNTLDRLSQLVPQLGVRVLGEIPRLAALQEQSVLLRAGSVNPRVGACADDLYAILRLESNPLQRIMITSTREGEGKSTLAALCAASFARHERVLLVDGDLRRGTLSRQLVGPSAKPGLAELLAAEAELADCLVQKEGLTLLLVGRLVMSPLALLGSPLWAELLVTLTYQFDRIIVDTPALELGKDALLLGQPLDGAIHVIQSGALPAGRVLTALEQLKTTRVPVLGAVLTQVAERQLEGGENLRLCGAPSQGAL
ncbi:GumC family protein [Aeromonas hydrophila]|uniref:GumC family protein n=1 Tax=Aeromonas hydrophila TaxID=644 RepID=UPI00385A602D